jgi:hypothetical protein
VTAPVPPLPVDATPDAQPAKPTTGSPARTGRPRRASASRAKQSTARPKLMRPPALEPPVSASPPATPHLRLLGSASAPASARVAQDESGEQTSRPASRGRLRQLSLPTLVETPELAEPRSPTGEPPDPIEQGYAGGLLVHEEPGWQPSNPADPAGPARSKPPDPGPQIQLIVRALMETLSGRRPTSQLQPHLTPTAYLQLITRMQRVTKVHRSRRSTGEHDGLQVGRPVLSVPSAGVVDASVVVHWSGRVRALTLRLELTDGRWQCALLEFVR